MTKNDLIFLRRYYPVKQELPKLDRNSDKPFIHLCDDELLKKFNSKEFKLHPIYPILTNRNGTEMYDIRDGFKTIIRNHINDKKRKGCKIRGYKGEIPVYHIVAEAWNKRLLLENENIHHIDFNKNNNDYTNLLMIDKIKHRHLHEIKVLSNKKIIK